MYLSRFGVKNYKCLDDIDIPLTPIHVLIGQNDCGKTSLLEAMAALFAMAETPSERIFPEPWIGRELVRYGSGASGIELSAECVRHPPDAEAIPYSSFEFGASIGFSFPDRQFCSISNRWIRTNGEKRPLTGKGRAGRREDIGHWADDSKAVSNILTPAHKYAFDAKQMALPAVFDSARKFRLDADGFGLATLLDDLLGFDPRVFLDIQEEFCRLFPQFQRLSITTEYAVARYTQSDGFRSGDGSSGPTGATGPSGPATRYTQSDGLPQSSVGMGKGIYLEMQSGETVRARHASDGAILFLGLLALAHLPKPPGLLLLEEPENGVYPTRLGQIIGLLKAMVNRTEGVRFPQIILTTHSPYVLSFFQPDEVTLLSRPPGAPDAPVRARPLRDAPNIKERMGEDEFYLGELWYNLSEEELFCEP